MRETRPSGSEGGAAQSNVPFLPLFASIVSELPLPSPHSFLNLLWLRHTASRSCATRSVKSLVASPHSFKKLCYPVSQTSCGFATQLQEAVLPGQSNLLWLRHTASRSCATRSVKPLVASPHSFKKLCYSGMVCRRHRRLLCCF
jgi:hypothetical protein